MRLRRLWMTSIALAIGALQVWSYQIVKKDGFESGGLTGWYLDGSYSILSSGCYAGSKCLKYQPTGAGKIGLEYISPAFREAFLQFYVKFVGNIPCTDCDAGGKHFWRFVDWPNHNVGFAHELDTGLRGNTYGLWFLSGGAGFNPAVPFEQNKWYKHTVRVKLESAPGNGDGHFVVEIDYSRYVDAHNQNLYGSWSGGWDNFVFTNYDGVTAHWEVDDFILVTGDGAYDYDDGSGITSVSITTPSLPDGNQGSPYEHALTAEGGTPPYQWSVVTGRLQPGLVLDSATGTISGTPEIPQLRKLVLGVADSKQPPSVTTKELTLNIGAPSAIGNASTASVNGLHSVIRQSMPGSVDFFSWLPENGDLTIQVRSITGKRVWQRDLGELAQGQHHSRMATHKMQPGVYVAVVQHNKIRQNLRFVITNS